MGVDQSAKALLSGFRRVYKSGAHYPILETAPNGRLEGLVVTSLRARDVVRLDAFEGANYNRGILQVVLCSNQEEKPAWVYLPKPNVRGTGKEWNLREWTRQHKRKYVNYISRVGTYPKSFS